MANEAIFMQIKLGHEAFTSWPLFPLGTGALDPTGLISERSYLLAGAVAVR